MSPLHTNGKNSRSTEDARKTCNRSSSQVSSLEDEKVNNEGRLSSLHHSIYLVQILTKRNSAMTSPSREKYITRANGKTNQDAVYWINLARAQDKGLQFWPTWSHAIIVCSTVSADCIHKVISQNGERTLFERLSTPQPAPKIVLKNAWQ